MREYLKQKWCFLLVVAILLLLNFLVWLDVFGPKRAITQTITSNELRAQQPNMKAVFKDPWAI